jgi:hypothetical protein
MCSPSFLPPPSPRSPLEYQLFDNRKTGKSTRSKKQRSRNPKNLKVAQEKDSLSSSCRS